VSEPLPKYRVRAKNTSTQSENKIHDDTLARRYGFRGGLVPGVIVYAYLTEPLVAGLGEAWRPEALPTRAFAAPSSTPRR